jgi:glycosyltransferase involved in cell wall biosynthesis
MIVKNEEHILDRCLKSIAPIADEIVIVDTGSTDSTIEIAKKYTKNIFHFEWIDDFSAARNFALTHCSHPIICTWDADWILRSNSLDILKRRKQEFRDFDRIFCSWNLEFDEDNNPTRQSRYHFFFKKDVFHWESPIHNELVPNNSRHRIKDLFIEGVEVDHYKDPTIKKDRYQQTEAILKQELKKNPHNTRLRIFLAQSYQFHNEYKKAIQNYKLALEDITLDETMKENIYERIGVCYINLKEYSAGYNYLKQYTRESKKIDLIRADLLQFLNPLKAYRLYKAIIEDPIERTPEDFDFYPERYLIHPYIMAAKLNLIIFRKKKAQEYLQQALTLTNNEKTKQRILSLL